MSSEDSSVELVEVLYSSDVIGKPSLNCQLEILGMFGEQNTLEFRV